MELAAERRRDRRSERLPAVPSSTSEVSVAVPPAETICSPALVIIVPLAMPPDDMNCVPPRSLKPTTRPGDGGADRHSRPTRRFRGRPGTASSALAVPPDSTSSTPPE